MNALFKRLHDPDDDAVSIEVGEQTVLAREGDSVAAALLTAGFHSTRRSPVSGTQRAPWCLMGTCFECLVVIDGVPDQQACITQVRAGMQVELQHAPIIAEGTPGTLDPWGLD